MVTIFHQWIKHWWDEWNHFILINVLWNPPLSVEIALPISNFDVFPRLLLCDIILCHGAGQPDNLEDKWPIYYQPFCNHITSLFFTFSTVFNKLVNFSMLSLVAQMVKCLPAMQKTQVQSLGWEDPLEKEMTTHSSILAWKIPQTEDPGSLQFMGSQRVGHNWATSLSFLL